MTNVDVILDHYLWKKKIKNPKIYIKKKIEKLSKLNLFKKKPKNHTIFLTNNRKMKALNKKFRNKNNPTDVLSFPFQKKTNYKKNIYLGDVAISYEIINKRSKNSNFFKYATKKNYIWSGFKTWKKETGYLKNKKNSLHVVAIDYGIKKNILRYFSDLNCKVTVVSCKTSAKDILKLKPNGIFLSNGPGDPAATGKYAIEIIKELIKNNLPIFGICLGHQILALALGAKTKKMKLGHRGANHPVKNLIKDNVEITSQNHGFEIVRATLPKNIEITHKSLFDNCIEGIRLKNKPVFSVQYHPESNPGPQDSVYLFEEFINNIKKNAKKKRS